MQYWLGFSSQLIERTLTIMCLRKYVLHIRTLTSNFKNTQNTEEGTISSQNKIQKINFISIILCTAAEFLFQIFD